MALSDIDAGIRMLPDPAKGYVAWLEHAQHAEELHQLLPIRLSEWAYWQALYNRKLLTHPAEHPYMRQLWQVVEKAKWRAAEAGANVLNPDQYFLNSEYALVHDCVDDLLAWQGDCHG